MLHADVSNLELLGKIATDPKFCLLFADLFTSLQTDKKTKQEKIFDLNKKFTVNMFSTAVRGGKVFAVEQRLRELKKRIFRLKAMEKRLPKKQNPYEIMKKSVDNMNSLPSEKNKQAPNEIEKSSLNSEASRERFNFVRSKKLEKKNLDRENLPRRFKRELGEEVLVLASRLKKKDSTGKFYNSSVDSKSGYNK